MNCKGQSGKGKAGPDSPHRWVADEKACSLGIDSDPLQRTLDQGLTVRSLFSLAFLVPERKQPNRLSAKRRELHCQMGLLIRMGVWYFLCK